MPEQPDDMPCEQPATACVPVAVQPVCVTAEVTVTPKVRCKQPTVICVGPPRVVKPGEKPCPDGKPTPDRKCRLTIAQNILVKVPVEFSANVECHEGEAFCLPTNAYHKEPAGESEPTPSRFLYTRSASFYQTQLFPANFADEELCRATQFVAAQSLFLSDLLAGHGCGAPGEPCPPVLPISCLNRLEALLTPASAVAAVQERHPDAPTILGLTARQLLALLLNAALHANTPLGLVGGLSMDCTLDLTRFPEAAALLASQSTVGALTALTDAALTALDADRAHALEPVLAAVNTDETPSIMLSHP